MLFSKVESKISTNPESFNRRIYGDYYGVFCSPAR